MSLGAEVGLIFLFILLGGVFVAAETSLVILRESQIISLKARGKKGQTVTKLSHEPNEFLSAVQIGITLSGFLSAALGGATLSGDFAQLLERIGVQPSISHTLALFLVTLIISYFSIVISELTAKRLAMQRTEAFALALAPMIKTITSFARPIVWLLGKSTNLLVRMLGGDPKTSKQEITTQELRSMLVDSKSLGIEQRRIVKEVFDVGEHTLREIMRPRTEVDFLPADMVVNQAIKVVRGAAHSRYPVTDGSPDRIIGFVHVRDLMDIDAGARSDTVRSLVRPVLSLPETVKALSALSAMRRNRFHLAIVKDEYGGTAGIVTLEDLVEELIGDISDEYDESPSIGKHTSNEIDGLSTIEEFSDLFGYQIPEGPYDTVAGYFMSVTGKVPELGEQITVELKPVGWDEDSEEQTSSKFNFKISVLDRRRAAWFVVRKIEDGTDLKENK